jgi:NADH:ubiquinone oxidoreductase subunit 3 (subunit A)
MHLHRRKERAAGGLREVVLREDDVKLVTTLLLLASIICSLVLFITSLSGACQLDKARNGFSDVSPQILQQLPSHRLPANEAGFQSIRQKDFESGMVVRYQLSIIPFLPVLFLAVAYLFDRRSLTTPVGTTAVGSAALLYLTAFVIVLWIWSWMR